MTRSKKTRSCSKSRNQEIKLENISFELVIEILLRLPVKSIARYRIVSKLWESTLASPYFTESFFTISSYRPPKLLFTCLKNGKTFFFSSPSPPCPLIVANFHTSFPIDCPYSSCRPVRGFVCGLRQRTKKGGTVTVPLICNPSTDQVITLPRLNTMKKRVIRFFGYDPINKHFKVLCMTKSLPGVIEYTEQHQVLTLETGKKTSLSSSWKMIKCDVQHAITGYCQSDNGICINGILYYLAYITSGNGFLDIVCFDIRLEEFSYIRRDNQDMNINMGAQLESTLVNYKGKLAKLQANIFNYNRLTGIIQLWVLEDAEKHKWSSFIYDMPPPWKNITKENTLCFVGTTRSGEIVLSPATICDVFYLVYYKPESNTISKVVIKGMEAFKHHKPYIFLDHVENVKILSNVSFGRS